MSQLPLFRQRIRWDGDWGTVLSRFEDSPMALVRFDGVYTGEVNSGYGGAEVLVNMDYVDEVATENGGAADG